MELILILLVICQLLDIWSTYNILKLGGRELNPVMKFIMDKLGLLPGLILFKGIFILFIIYYYLNLKTITNTDYIFVSIITIFYAYIIRNNILVLRSMKEKNKIDLF